MFIKDEIMFYNVGEFDYDENIGGYHISRVPNDVIEQLRYRIAAGMNIRDNYKKPAGSEIRFIIEDDAVFLTLYAQGINTFATIFYGETYDKKITLQDGYNCIKLELPEKLKALNPKKKMGRFTPNLVRICFLGQNVTYYISKTGKTRVPDKDELPEKTLMAYGTSITQGAGASSSELTYISQTANRLGMDCRNLGIGGGACCEPAIADYIATDKDWDIATICISVNMLCIGDSLEKFHKFAKNLVETIHNAHPDKPIFCISPFSFFGDYKETNKFLNNEIHPDEYRKALEEIVQTIASENVYYINGRELLPSLLGLKPDLIHPSDLGMIEIADNLSKRIKSSLKTD